MRWAALTRLGVGLIAVVAVLALPVEPSYAHHGAPDPHAKLIRVGYCYEIKAEGSIWKLQSGTCGDMAAYIIKYFHGTTTRCDQPGPDRVVCHLPYHTIASATRRR